MSRARRRDGATLDFERTQRARFGGFVWISSARPQPAMTMTLTRSNPETLPVPPGYSQLVTTDGPTAFVAGQVALTPDGRVVGEGDFESQCRQVFTNLLTAVRSAGGSAETIVKLNTYVTRMSDLSTYRRVRDEFIPASAAPASTLIEVPHLFRPEFLVEIEAVVAVRR